MSDLIYSTESEEHKINIGEKEEPQWCELTEEELKWDLMDSWDTYDRIHKDT